MLSLIQKIMQKFNSAFQICVVRLHSSEEEMRIVKPIVFDPLLLCHLFLDLLLIIVSKRKRIHPCIESFRESWRY